VKARSFGGSWDLMLSEPENSGVSMEQLRFWSNVELMKAEILRLEEEIREAEQQAVQPDELDTVQ